MANWLKEQFRNFVTLCISQIFCAKNLFDVITSNISFIRGANTQERDVTAGPEKREKVCGATSTRSQAIGYRATRTRIQATD